MCGAPVTVRFKKGRINRHTAYLSLSRLAVGKEDSRIDARELNVRKNQKAFLCAGEIDKRNAANPNRNNNRF